MMLRSNVIGTEQFAARACARLSEEQRAFAQLYQTPDVDRRLLLRHLHRSMRAERAAKAALAALDDADSRTPEARQARLSCEGVALVSLICGFIGLFLPDLTDHFWPLTMAFGSVAALAGWSVHFAGRVAAHFGR